MTQSSDATYRVWNAKEQSYTYYDTYPKDIEPHLIFKNTMIKENVHEHSEDNQFIYEGDQVNIRDIEERFNCGGDNTIDNTGEVVWKDDCWQLHCQLDNDFSYMHDSDYYVLLEQPGTKRTIL